MAAEFEFGLESLKRPTLKQRKNVVNMPKEQ